MTQGRPVLWGSKLADRYRLLTLILVAVVGSVAAMSGGSAVDAARLTAARLQPKTLVVVKGEIGAFAHDRDRIAWLAPRARCTGFVNVRELRTGRTHRLAAARGPTCPPRDYYDRSLALASDRALWSVGWFTAAGLSTRSYVQTVISATAGRGREAVVFRTSENDVLEEEMPVFAAEGSGSTLMFSFGRDLYRVVGQRAIKLAEGIPPEAVAAGESTIAVARLVEPATYAYIRQPSWSSADVIAFVSNRDDGGLFTVKPDGTGLRRLTRDAYIDPTWSPDGGRIAFVSAPGDGDELAIEVIDPESGREWSVGPGWSPVWSPSGRELAFARNAPEPDYYRVIIAAADGSHERVLAPGADPTWSPDGKLIAFRGNGIEVVAPDGSGRRLVAEDGTGPDWSPAGDRLAFVGDGGIEVVNRDGSGRRRLVKTPDDRVDWDPVWSPDGSAIAFSRDVRSRGDDYVDPHVWIVGSDGSGAHQLTAGMSPAWAPDGSRLVVTDDELFVVNRDGGGRTRLTNTPVREAKTIVTVYRTATGERVVDAAIEGDLNDIAVSETLGAALVSGHFGTRLTFFDPRSGSVAGSLDVDAKATDVSVSGKRVVFRVGRQIKLLAEGAATTIALAATTPRDLSIDGRRVAWVENLSRSGRIRALIVP